MLKFQLSEGNVILLEEDAEEQLRKMLKKTNRLSEGERNMAILHYFYKKTWRGAFELSEIFDEICLLGKEENDTYVNEIFCSSKNRIEKCMKIFLMMLMCCKTKIIRIRRK